MKAEMSRRWPEVPVWALYVAPALAALLAYWPATRNGFIWDDPQVLLQMRAIRSFGDLLVPPAIIPKFYFRPLIFVSYLIDRSIAGEAPYWFHISVIAAHAVASVLVALLTLRWLPQMRMAAVAAGLLFAVWPVHTESVAWMAGRSDVIVGVFLLGAVLVADQKDEWRSGWLAALLLFAALLSKEIAITGLGLIVGTDLLRRRGWRMSRIVPGLAVTVLYVVLRQIALASATASSAGRLPFDVVLTNAVYAFGYYVTQAFVPVSLAAYVDQVPHNPIYLLVAALVCGATLAAVLRGGTELRAVALAMVMWFVLPLAPTFLVLLGDSASAPVADRYVYVPSVAAAIGLAVGSVAAAQRFKLPFAAWAAFLLVIAIAAGMRTATYAQAWTSNTTFWIEAAAKNPTAALPAREVANGLMEQRRHDEAIEQYKRALTLKNDAEGLVTIHTNLGSLYRRQGKLDAAIQELETALQVGKHPAIYHNLGMTLMAVIEQADKRGDQATVRREIVRAKQAFEQALALQNAPASSVFLTQWQPAKTHALLGQVYLSMGEAAKARHHFEESLRLEPTGAVADTTRDYLKRMPQ